MKTLAVSKYVRSRKFHYVVDSKYQIPFHLRFYRQYSEDKPNCAVYFEIDPWPKSIRRVSIEVDFKCCKKPKGTFVQILQEKTLTADERISGFQTFGHEEVESCESMEWIVAVKMYNPK